jgi:hypothetical protein
MPLATNNPRPFPPRDARFLIENCSRTFWQSWQVERIIAFSSDDQRIGRRTSSYQCKNNQGCRGKNVFVHDGSSAGKCARSTEF